ncbi:MAG: hypothetical protein Q4C33_01410 [bacterium]|nr:hypothetical protein [bacterium]
MTNNKNNADKKRLRVYYGMLITVLCIIGVSFAWFRLYLSQSENNTIASRTCFSTTLTEDTEKIALTEAFPLTDADGLKETPFTFTIKNNCASYVKAYITIDSEYRTSTSSSYLSDNYIKVNLSPGGTTSNPSVILGGQTLTDIDNSRKGYILSSIYLKANEEKTYDLRIWMDAAVTADQGLNKSWAGKIVVVTSASNEPTLSEKILADNVVQKTISNPGYEPSAYTYNDVESTTDTFSNTNVYITYGTGYEANGYKINLTGTEVTTDTYANSYSSLVGKYLPYQFSSTSAGTMRDTTNLYTIYYVVSATADSLTYKEIRSNKNVTEALLSSTEDDYGTSYYFRGTVKNNYVEFANMCWRIVRITGNGSVKLVLHNNNLNGVSSPCSSVNNLNTGAFAKFSDTATGSVFNTSGDDNAYVGFMYGTAGGSSYAEAQANINKSTVLTNLETWYKNNLMSYEDKLADVIWCNDKSVVTDTTINIPYVNSKNDTNFGYGTNANGYNATLRLTELASSSNNIKPSLKCSNDNDGGNLSKFTVSDITNGNGALDYKIGLLTMDEIIFAGNYGFYNGDYNYLWENTGGIKYWSMTPAWFTGAEACMFVINNNRILLGSDCDPVAMKARIRPSIALDSSVQLSGGTGTSEDPYIVK